MKGKISVDQAIELLEDAGESPRSYSGRGMYGARCVAIEPDRGDLMALGIEVAREAAGRDADLEAVADAFRGARIDSMGRGIVVYWPSLAWPDGRVVDGEEGRR